MKNYNRVSILVTLILTSLPVSVQAIMETGPGRNCDTLGVDISLPGDYFVPGDLFEASAILCNPTESGIDAGVFIYISPEISCIPIFPEYPCPEGTVFAPSFSSEMDWYYVSLPPESEFNLEIIPSFVIPDDPEIMSGLFTQGSGTYYFQGFIASPDFTQILGEYDIVRFVIDYSSTVHPTPTPAETALPTETPTPTMTPTPMFPVMIDLLAPGDCIEPGDLFYLYAWTRSARPEPIRDTALFVVLEVFDEFYFYPEWVHFGPPDYLMDYVTVDIRDETLRIFEVFTWPQTECAISEIHFYCMALSSDLTAPVSDLETWTWRLNPDCGA